RFVLIESIMQKCAQESSALRHAEPKYALDIFTRIAEQRLRASIFEKRDHITNGGGPEPDQHGIFGLIDHLIDLAGLEARLHFYFRRSCELPLTARNDLTLTGHALPH